MLRLQKKWIRLFLIVITVLAVYKSIPSGSDSEAGNIKDMKPQLRNILRSDPTEKKQDQGDNMTKRTNRGGEWMEYITGHKRNIKDMKPQLRNILRSDPTEKKQDQGDNMTKRTNRGGEWMEYITGHKRNIKDMKPQLRNILRSDPTEKKQDQGDNMTKRTNSGGEWVEYITGHKRNIKDMKPQLRNILRSDPTEKKQDQGDNMTKRTNSGGEWVEYITGHKRNIKDMKPQLRYILRPDPTEKKQDQGDSMTFIEERNKMRIAKVKQTCNTLKSETGERHNSQPIVRNVMNPNRDITWCRVNKAASTYTFEMLTEIFNCSIDRMHATAREVRELPYTDMRKMIAKSYKFTFVREPFQRLFSTYSNKFYFPKNHWAPIGPKVVKRYRHRPSRDSLIYGHNITFYEMIKFTVEEYEAGHRLDEHLRPMHEHCYPCDYQYDFIGKLETMVSDWTYLTNEWSRTIQINVPNKAGKKTLHFNETKHMLDTFVLIEDSTISRYKLYLRAWAYYKMLGYIYKHFDMPFGENSEIKFKDFRNALEEAAEKSKPYAEETKRQKTDALKQAYASVPLELLERLRKVVALDCMLYGYDNKPDWVFDRKDVQADFNYFQGLE